VPKALQVRLCHLLLCKAACVVQIGAAPLICTLSQTEQAMSLEGWRRNSHSPFDNCFSSLLAQKVCAAWA